MSKITVELKLSDEDQAAIVAAVAAQIDAAKGKATKAAPAAKGGKGKAKPPADDDDFENVDGTADAEGDDDDDFDAAPEITREDVQTALREYAAVSSKAEAMKLLKKIGGSDTLSALDESKFAAVIKAAKAKGGK